MPAFDETFIVYVVCPQVQTTVYTSGQVTSNYDCTANACSVVDTCFVSKDGKAVRAYITENVMPPVEDFVSTEASKSPGASTLLSSRNVQGLSVSGYDIYVGSIVVGTEVSMQTEYVGTASDALYSNDERPDEAAVYVMCFPAVSYLNLCVARGVKCNSIDDQPCITCDTGGTAGSNHRSEPSLNDVIDKIVVDAIPDQSVVYTEYRSDSGGEDATVSGGDRDGVIAFVPSLDVSKTFEPQNTSLKYPGKIAT